VSAQLLMLEHVVDANRALDALRDQPTLLRVRAGEAHRRGNHSSAHRERLHDLEMLAERMRQVVYADSLDQGMVELAQLAAPRT
jgi:hypothetical protein